jgi:pimeloyl-ACP methyl ester carboxylesterase
MTDERIVSAGIATQVRRRGEGPTVLMLHGNPDTGALWEPVVARLGEGVHTVVPDLPGFGGSAPHPDRIHLSGMAAWVDGLVPAAADPVHLVVHDFGGPYGLAWAVLHPERLASVTLTNTLFHPDFRWHFWARVWRTPGLGELAAVLTPGPVFRAELRKGGPGLTAAQRDEAWRAFRWRTRWAVLDLYRAHDPSVLGERVPGRDEAWHEAWARVAERVPSQVIWGDRDPYLGEGWRLLGVETVHHLPEAGHWAPAEAPEAFTEHLRALIQAPSQDVRPDPERASPPRP